jgi:RNA polymerase sigma factor (sigma-70 family)
MATINGGAVGLMTAFLSSGEGFDALWSNILPFVDESVRKRLRSRQVRGQFTLDDEAAVDEAIQHVAVALVELPKKDPVRWFDPTVGKGGVDGLQGWLYGFCRTAVAEYCERYHNAKRNRKVSVTAESFLPLNEQMEANSILKSAVKKVEVDDAEMREIINACVTGMADEALKNVVRLNMWEGFSERKIADRTGMSPATVHRRLQEAFTILKPALTRRGIDADWFAEAA